MRTQKQKQEAEDAKLVLSNPIIPLWQPALASPIEGWLVAGAKLPPEFGDGARPGAVSELRAFLLQLAAPSRVMWLRDTQADSSEQFTRVDWSDVTSGRYELGPVVAQPGLVVWLWYEPGLALLSTMLPKTQHRFDEPGKHARLAADARRRGKPKAAPQTRSHVTHVSRVRLTPIGIKRLGEYHVQISAHRATIDQANKAMHPKPLALGRTYPVPVSLFELAARNLEAVS